MNVTPVDRAAQLLSELIALPTVNPMGQAYHGRRPVERPVVERLERLFSSFDVEMRRIPSSPIHESLLITAPGRSPAPGTLLESHIDTVPADDWLDRAFTPRRNGDTLFGRGACDDKGSLTAMALALVDVLESGAKPPQTVWLLAAADEEHAQTGIKAFLAQHASPIGRAIFGEPTECLPVVQHKGVIRWDITVHGTSAHSSRPERGSNAILGMMRVIARLTEHERMLQQRFISPLTGAPTIAVTMIHGGRTRNMTPETCTIAVDFRIVPGMEAQGAIEALFNDLASLEIPLSHSDPQCCTPALNTRPDDPLVQRAVDVCRAELACDVAPAGVPYGSDACWTPESTPAIVLGPGDIAHAHAVDECVELTQVVQATAIYRRLALTDWS